MPGNTVQGGGAVVWRAFFLRAFYFFPLRPNLIHALRFLISKDVGMSTNEFFHEIAGDLLEVERLAFSGELAVKYDLKEQIAEFLQHFLVVPCFDGVDELINLLNGVESEGFVVLFAIPGASCG